MLSGNLAAGGTGVQLVRSVSANQRPPQPATIVVGSRPAGVGATTAVVGQPRSSVGGTLVVRGGQLRHVTSAAVADQTARAGGSGQPMFARLVRPSGQGGAIRLVRASSGQAQGQVRTVTGAQLRALTSQGQVRTAVIQQGQMRSVPGSSQGQLRGVSVVQALRLPVTTSANT